MTKEEVQKTIETLKEVAKRVKKSESKTLEILSSTGAYTKSGKLRKSYQ